MRSCTHILTCSGEITTLTNANTCAKTSLRNVSKSLPGPCLWHTAHDNLLQVPFAPITPPRSLSYMAGMPCKPAEAQLPMGSSLHHAKGALGRSLCLCKRRAKQSLVRPDNRHPSPPGEQWSSPRVSPASQPLSDRAKPCFSSSTAQRDPFLSELSLSRSKTTLLPLLTPGSHPPYCTSQ